MSGEGLQCFIRMCQLQPSNQPFTDQGNHVHGTGRGFCTSEVQELGREGIIKINGLVKKEQ